jgi:hypothetical protein
MWYPLLFYRNYLPKKLLEGIFACVLNTKEVFIRVDTFVCTATPKSAVVPSRPPVQGIPAFLHRGYEDAGNNFDSNGFLVLFLDTFSLCCVSVAGWLSLNMQVKIYFRDLPIAWCSLQQSWRKFVESLCLEYTPDIRVGEVAAPVRRIYSLMSCWTMQNCLVSVWHRSWRSYIHVLMRFLINSSHEGVMQTYKTVRAVSEQRNGETCLLHEHV